MRSVEEYQAHWGVTFPVGCDVETACGIMEGFLIPSWSWDGFVWEPEELHCLLCARVATHDYVHATRFLMARAAYLALNGPFVVCLSRVREGIAKHGIQFGGIYRHMTLRALDGALQRQRAVAGTHGGRRREHGRLFLADMASLEREYLHVLEVVSNVPHSETTVGDHPVRSWVRGELGGPGQPSTILVPQAVSVRVEVEVTGRYRNVMPSPEELQAKLETNAPVRMFRERNGIGTQHDVELERMCGADRIGGRPVVFWGEEGFEIFRATTNEEKTTLYVVGLDRTMRIQQAGRSPPGSMPQTISVPEGPGAVQGTYVVKFDSGVEDVFTLSFRAHKEKEERAVALAVRCQKRRVGLGHSTLGAGVELSGKCKVESGKLETGGSKLETGDVADGIEGAGVGKREVGSSKLEIAQMAQSGNAGKAEGGTGGVTHEELRDTMVEGFGSLKRERIEDAVRASAQTLTIKELALGPDKFLAGLNARMSKEDVALLVELVTKVEGGGRRRPRTYDDIGKRLGGVSRQAVLGRMNRLYARHPTVRAYVETERDTKKEMTFSEGSDSWRRQAGVDEAYGRASGKKWKVGSGK